MPDLQVVINQTLYSQQVRNVLHIFYDAPANAAGRQDVSDFVRSNWVASGLAAIQVENWSLDSCSIRECGSTGPHALHPFTSGPLVGGYTAGDVPSQNALLVTLINNGLVPPTRGRIYLAGVNQDTITSQGLWPSSALQLADDLVSGFQNGLTGASQFLDLRIASRNPNGTCDVLNTVDSVLSRGIVATQRRRRISVGS